MALADLLAALRVYRPGLLLWDDAIAGLRVSGVFPLDDTDRVLQALAQALPIQIRYVTRYGVWIGARPG